MIDQKIVTDQTVMAAIRNTIFCRLLLVQLYQYSVNDKFHNLESDGHSPHGLGLYTGSQGRTRVATTTLRSSTLCAQASLNNTRIMITDATGNIEMYADPYETGLDGARFRRG